MNLKIKQKVTQEESNQLTAMLNWAIENTENEIITTKIFKRYNMKDECYQVVYKVETIDWSGRKHKTSYGEGLTLLEAMQDLSRKL